VSMSSGQVNAVEKSLSNEEGTYILKRVYHVHGTNNGLKKLTVCVYGELSVRNMSMFYPDTYPCCVCYAHLSLFMVPMVKSAPFCNNFYMQNLYENFLAAVMCAY